ncbi:MAG: hypothetical protein JW804_07295 [Sedimentisphaerales bacterium]|nr:hypothetical protein [Sedimentisphaerales bacterium]
MVQKKKNKMALYEVFSKGLANSRRSRSLETLRPTAEQKVSQGRAEAGFRPARNMPPKPRMFQINRGRLEISMPTQLAVAVLLILAALVLTAYRLGEWQGLDRAALSKAVEENSAQPAGVQEEIVTPEAESEDTSEAAFAEDSASGANWIVIATHKNKDQLIPVQAFFAGYGIETQIRQKGETFFLHTKQTYDNPGRLGTDGYRTRQEIIKIGASYEPPPGYRNFDFSTVYGMKSFE